MRTLKKRQLAQAGTGPETIALDKTASGDCDMTRTCIIGAFEMAALKMLTRSATIHQHSVFRTTLALQDGDKNLLPGPSVCN